MGFFAALCFTQVFARCLGKDSSKFRIPNISQSLVFNHPNQVLSSINFLVGGLKWFGTFGSFSIIYIGIIHQPLTFIFFEMVETTTQMKKVVILLNILKLIILHYGNLHQPTSLNYQGLSNEFLTPPH